MENGFQNKDADSQPFESDIPDSESLQPESSKHDFNGENSLHAILHKTAAPASPTGKPIIKN